MPSNAAHSSNGGARLLIRYRWLYISLCVALSIFMFEGVRRVSVTSSFSELLPINNSIVEVFQKYPNFSAPITIELLVKVKRGTIYNPQTLATIFHLTRDVDLLPGADHDEVISIATTKAQVVRAVPGGIFSAPVMGDTPPTTQEEADEISQRARSAGGVMGFLASRDGRAALIRASFHEQDLDYEKVFGHVHALCAKYRDANTEIYPAGFVMLVGWIYRYGRQAIEILLVAFALIALAHFDYMRSWAGSLTPLIAGALSVLCGVGAGGWIGINLDPLTIVVPVLLLARGLSHSVQMTRRYFERLYETNDRQVAAAQALGSMFSPAVLGIACDAVGLYLLYLVPIPVVRQLGVFCGTWSLLLIPTVVLLTPALLAIMPPPANVARFIAGSESTMTMLVITPLQQVFARVARGRMRWASMAVVVVVAAVTFAAAIRREVGNVEAGSSLLWPQNEFNVAMREINRELAGTTVLNVVWHGKKAHALATAEAYTAMQEFQRRIESAHGATATFSFSDFLSPTNMILGGGYPKWWPVDPVNPLVGRTALQSLNGRNVKDVAFLADYTLTNGAVTLWYKDLKSKTVTAAMDAARETLAPVANLHPEVYSVELAAGPVAAQYAIDKTVASAHLATLARLLAAVFVLSALTYYSLLAPLMLIVPLLLAQFTTDTIMFLRGVGLDINTLPVVAVGVGVGIDYGIYMLSRATEEYQAGDFDRAIERSIMTVGESTLFVAFTMVVAVLPWYFLCQLRFLAEMGLMLALVMALNAILAMTALPVEIAVLRPRFMEKMRRPGPERNVASSHENQATKVGVSQA